jgi:hypothetical protein
MPPRHRAEKDQRINMKNSFLLIPLVLVVLAVADSGFQTRKQTEWGVRFHRHGQDVVAIAAKDREVARLLAQSPTTEAQRQALTRARLALQDAVKTERADRKPLEGYFRTTGR